MKKIAGLGLLFLLAGVLAAKLVGTEVLPDNGILSQEQLRMLGEAETDTDRMVLFWYILWERGKLLVFVGLLCATALRKLVPWIGAAAVGFVAGFFGTMCVAEAGLIGALLVLAVFLPHGIVYWASLGILYQLRPVYSHEGRRRRAGQLLRLASALGVFLSGVLMETVVGTWLLQMICSKL